MKINLLFTVLGFLTMSITAFAGIPVKGLVLDEESQPLVGVAVIEDGTNNKNAVFTDLDGCFTLEVESEASILLFNSMGFKLEKLPVSVGKDMEVVLTSEQNELDGVVVIGYGTSRKSDLTGAVSSLRTSDIEDDQSASFTGMLAGRIPGVHAVSSGGAPGAKTNITIRGASSVSGGTEPLYVIDGVMMGGSANEMSGASWMGDTELDPLSMINPSDIGFLLKC